MRQTTHPAPATGSGISFRACVDADRGDTIAAAASIVFDLTDDGYGGQAAMSEMRALARADGYRFDDRELAAIARLVDRLWHTRAWRDN